MLCHAVLDWDVICTDVGMNATWFASRADTWQAYNVDVDLRFYSDYKPAYNEERGVHEPFEPLYQWAMDHKLRMMSMIIQLGFELDLYQPDEMAGMYW